MYLFYDYRRSVLRGTCVWYKDPRRVLIVTLRLVERREGKSFTWAPRRLGGAVSLRNIKYTKMCHFKKQNFRHPWSLLAGVSLEYYSQQNVSVKNFSLPKLHFHDIAKQNLRIESQLQLLLLHFPWTDFETLCLHALNPQMYFFVAELTKFWSSGDYAAHVTWLFFFWLAGPGWFIELSNVQHNAIVAYHHTISRRIKKM